MSKHSVRCHSSDSDSTTMRRGKGRIAMFGKSMPREEKSRGGDKPFPERKKIGRSESGICKKLPFQTSAHADDSGSWDDDCVKVGVHVC